MIKTLRTEFGFTVIEQLVTVAIVTVLLSMLYPAIVKARQESAPQTSCAFNMKQLSMAIVAYAQDYDDTLPGSADAFNRLGGPSHSGWVPALPVAPGSPCQVENGAIYAYVNDAKAYLCPADNYGKWKRLSYAMNSNCGHRSLREVSQEAKTILLVDQNYYLNDGCFVVTGSTTDTPMPSHNGAANCVFLDGHIQCLPLEQIPTSSEYWML